MNDKTTVFYFSPIPYDFLDQRPQQLVRAWRSNFRDSYDFYYVEYPAVRRFMVRRSRHLKQSLETLLLKKHNKNAEDAFVLTWLGVPRFFRGSAVRRALGQRCGKKQTKVAIVASPFWEPFVSKDNFDLVCYDYLDPVELVVDDFYPVQEQHKKLIGKSDIIFVTAQNLREDALSIADEKDVVTVSNGTDADFFEMNKNSYEITDYTRTDKQRVGYMGTYHRVDMDLLHAAAQDLTEVDFLLIGPLDPQDQRRAHQKPENVFILGTKKYEQLPAYVQLFDVALIPFTLSIIADSSDPVKLYDYFSLGKPVVATSLRELKRFDDGHLLRVAETQDEFVNGIKAFLKHDTKAWQESRRQIARQNSWLNKATLIIKSIESRIAERPST
jgi:teichuronic acid biosynthesis glycosyltransferase TuaH